MHFNIRMFFKLFSCFRFEHLIMICLISFHFFLRFLSLRSSLRSSWKWLKLHSWTSKLMKDELCISASKRLTSLSLLGHSLSHSSRHLLHHHIKRTPLSAPLIPKPCSKRLRKYTSEVLISKSLLKNFVDVNIVKASCWAFAKLVITSSFAFIAKSRISLSDMLKCVHRAWSAVFIRVNFKRQLYDVTLC